MYSFQAGLREKKKVIDVEEAVMCPIPMKY